MLPRKAATVLVWARSRMRRSSKGWTAFWFAGENQKLAHLFMICSNIKLVK